MSEFEPKPCPHEIAAGCCYECAQDEAEEVRNRKENLKRVQTRRATE